MTAHSQKLSASKLLIKKIVKNQNSDEELDGLYLVCGEEGCQPKGSLVLMANGRFKNVEDVKVGDCVLSPLEDGTYIYSNVIQLHQFYSSKNYIVKTLNRNQKELYKCSYNHIIPMNKTITHRIKGTKHRRIREWKVIEKTAKEWNKYTYQGLKNFTTPLASPIPYFINNIDCEIEPYTLGVLLGDGSLCEKQLNITSNDTIIIDYISKYYPCMSVSGKQKTTAKTYRYSQKSLLFNQLDKLGLIGHRSGTKFIPDVAKYSSIDYRRKLLAGLIDTDGYYAGKRTSNIMGRANGGGSYSITSKSKQLIEDISFICGTLGYRYNIRTITKTIKSIDFMGVYYQISFYIESTNQLPVLLERKKHNGNRFYLSSNRVSIKLEETNPEMVYGFTLDSPSGLYITDNFCVTHNSGKSNTILWLSQLWEEETGKHLSINNIARNLKELFKELKIHSKFCVALDEGYELKATNMWDVMVKKIEKAYMMGRYRANLSLIAYTNPFKINSYFKEDRAKGIFFCYKRRIFLYYNREDLREIRQIMSKAGNIKSINDLYEIEMYRRKATFIEYGIDKYNGHLAQEYKKRKEENYLKEMEEMEEDVDVVTYSLNKTCKILGVSDATIRKCIEAKVIEPEWNATGTKMRLRQDDLDKLKVYLKPQEV